MADQLTGRLTPRRQVENLVRKLKGQSRRIVFTNGVVDLLHRGHVEYLARARRLGDVLIFGLNSDASARRLKGPARPVNKQSDRAAVLLALRSVDYVVVFSEDTPEKLIKQIRPDVLAKGADYRLPEIVGADFVRSYGGQVRRIPLTQGHSTSNVLARITGVSKARRVQATRKK